jgi:hypothetical protein
MFRTRARAQLLAVPHKILARRHDQNRRSLRLPLLLPLFLCHFNPEVCLLASPGQSMQVLEELAVFTIGTDEWVWQIIVDLKEILLFKPRTLFVLS